MRNAITTGDKHSVSIALREYKLSNGAANFPELFKIPKDQRIQVLAEKDFRGTSGIITAGLTLAMESMNLKNPLNAIQILDLAEAIIDTASEDNLAIEDLMLFLQGLVRGRYGALYESMDLPKFLEKFEIYRQERWSEGIRIRDEGHLQYKGMGDATRTTQPNELAERFSSMGNKLSELKDQLKEKTKENNILRQANKFYDK